MPTLFLPYPHHRDAHQRNNAQPIVDLGGAVIADDRIESNANVAGVGPVLFTLMADDASRDDMRSRLLEHRSRDAAASIADLLLA